ncbi:MAG TPA: hypothetical protein VFV50_04220 [Bdellovibrionales bacterium]|nr:hypothetical protein [Bdellovibrionales bacterium]
MIHPSRQIGIGGERRNQINQRLKRQCRDGSLSRISSGISSGLLTGHVIAIPGTSQRQRSGCAPSDLVVLEAKTATQMLKLQHQQWREGLDRGIRSLRRHLKMKEEGFVKTTL